MFLSAVQSLLPPLQAASQLSQAELEELLAENAKLKQLLSTYKDRLAPEQVRGWAGVRFVALADISRGRPTQLHQVTHYMDGDPG